jgi:hypothetical protein
MVTMPDDVPSPIRIFEPVPDAAPSAAGTRGDVVIPEPVRAAARRVLARDGRDFVLQPWQAGFLVATAEGREGFVPPACGVGRGWLQARIDEEIAREG